MPQVMDRQTRNAFQIYCLYLIVSVAVFSIEYSQVSPDLIHYFVLLKCSFFFLDLSCVVFLYRTKKFNFWIHFYLLFSLLIHPAVGELFRPTYEYALFGVFIVASMFIPLSRKIIFSTTAFSTIAFCIVYYCTYERNLKLVVEMNVYDNLFTFLLFGIVAVYVSHTLNFERDLRNKAQSRYSLIGTQASAIVHDLKNILSNPRLQIDNLRQAVQPMQSPEIIQSIDEIEATLNHAALAALRFNQMTVLSNTDRVDLQVVDVISEVKHILNRRLSGIELIVTGDRQITVDQGFITSLFLNLFLNSISAMEKNSDKKITISINDKKIVFQDSGPGFSAEALKNISKNISYTDKIDGSGNGLRIIKEACYDLGAQVNFYNTEIGACVDIFI